MPRLACSGRQMRRACGRLPGLAPLWGVPAGGGPAEWRRTQGREGRSTRGHSPQLAQCRGMRHESACTMLSAKQLALHGGRLATNEQFNAMMQGFAGLLAQQQQHDEQVLLAVLQTVGGWKRAGERSPKGVGRPGWQGDGGQNYRRDGQNLHGGTGREQRQRR